jgi:hypothetical protein
MSILDSFSTRPGFTPSSVNDYFALQLARKLGDPSNISCYVQLCVRFGKDHLLRAYSAEHATGGPNLAERFRRHFH